MYPGWLRVSLRGSSEIRHEIGRAFDAGWAAVENVGVDLRGADVTVSQELLDGANIVARKAWFWVDAATSLSTTRALRNCVTSAPPISAGWRLRWKRMNRRIHAT